MYFLPEVVGCYTADSVLPRPQTMILSKTSEALLMLHGDDVTRPWRGMADVACLGGICPG
jgi:hypothetical protein